MGKPGLESNSPDAPLIGQLYLFRTLAPSRKTIDSEISGLFDRFREIERNPFDEQRMRDAYKETHTLLSETCEIHADVILDRNGVICIRKILWSNDSEREESVNYAETKHLNIDAEIANLSRPEQKGAIGPE